MKRYISILLSLIVLSCAGPSELEPVQSMVYVRLSLHAEAVLDLDCNETSDDITKAVVDPEVTQSTPVEDVIKNFWVVQFDGTSDAARILGEARYFPDMEAYLKPAAQGGHDEQVQLVASSVESVVVIIANTFDKDMSFPQGSTLADLKKRLRTVSDDQNFLSANGTDRFLVFSGFVTSVISQGVRLECTLKRNVAKVNIKIVNSSSDVTVNSWQLRSVPSVSYYFTNFELPEIWPAVGDFTVIDFPLQSADKVSPGDEASFLSYLPVNKWGVVDAVANEEYKNDYAPEGATYLQINAESGGEPLTYRFYLGGNMTTDFNILPNVSYTFTFEIKSKGDAEYDSRVDESLLVDFANSNDETANCYVINPAEIDGQLRRFRIPVKRVDEFWGGRGYEDVPENTLGSTGQWQVEMLTSNFDNSDGKLTFTKHTGTGSHDAQTAELQYFEFTVKPGTKGSAIVGIRKGGGDILWSWHLWITDYAPDQAYEHTPLSGVYAYDVTGGVVHRYEGEKWHGEYAKRYMMDRNLGAISTGYEGSGNGSVYYQFGRKDPFFGPSSYGFNEFSVTNYAQIPTSPDPSYTLRYSISNPLVYIHPGRDAWTKDNKYNPTQYDATIAWQDPYTSTKQYMTLSSEKSIFDPCPPGYCIPSPGAWDDFRYNDDKGMPTTNVGDAEVLERNFPQLSDVNGVCYWPYPASGDADNLPSQSELVFYPAAGYMENLSISRLGLMWFGAQTSSMDVKNASGIKMGEEDGKPYISVAYSLARNLGLPVRCITSRDAE